MKDQHIRKVDAIKFQPQATIQYPLEYYIPMLFRLFGFKKGKDRSDPVKSLVDSLPFLDDINEIKTQGIERYIKKEIGLIFLHAATLSGFTPSATNSLNLLNEINERFSGSLGQVDAKSTLCFMSRRPISEMWRDIKNSSSNCCTLYEEGMRKNKIFAQKFFNLSETRTNIEWRNDLCPNYGEELFSENGRKDLTFLKDFFIKDFASLWNEGPIFSLKDLLTNGIITTAMISNLDPNKVEVTTLDNTRKTPQDLFKTYYRQSVETIENPSVRYEFMELNAKKVSLSEVVFGFDTLSPPLFLDLDDSMGFFSSSNNIKIASEDIQKYGEAIVEIRNLKTCCLAYLRAENWPVEPDPSIINFLTQGDESLLIHSIALFNFLKNLKKENFLSSMYIEGILYSATI